MSRDAVPPSKKLWGGGSCPDPPDADPRGTLSHFPGVLESSSCEMFALRWGVQDDRACDRPLPWPEPSLPELPRRPHRVRPRAPHLVCGSYASRCRERARRGEGAPREEHCPPQGDSTTS